MTFVLMLLPRPFVDDREVVLDGDMLEVVILTGGAVDEDMLPG